MQCPTCNKPVKSEDNAFLPFCSERCKLIDLGAWFDEKYSVPGNPVDLEGEPQAEENE